MLSRIKFWRITLCLRKVFIQWVDDVQIRLKEPFDLSFLRQYGTVFKVYDTQSSGNL